MTISPRILYCVHALPIKLCQKFFSKLYSLQWNLIWAHKQPHIKLTLLSKLKAQSGMGLPNFKYYYYAAHLTRIVDWHHHEHNKYWVTLEHTWLSSPFKCMPWIPNTLQPLTIKQHPLIPWTFTDKLSMDLQISSTPNPLTPLPRNPEFPTGLENTRLFPNINDAPLQVTHCCQSGKIKSLTDL